MVALVPISFPLAKNRESWLEFQFDKVVFPFGVGCTNVSDIVIVVEAMNVLW